MCYNDLNLVDRLKVYMVLNGINQTQLGRMLEVSQPVVSRLFAGNKASLQLENRIRNLIDDH